MIELPKFVPAAPTHVDSSSHPLTSVPDVWRHYDLEKHERVETPPLTLVPPTVEPA